MKTHILIFMFLYFYVSGFGQDTLNIYRVGQPKGHKYAYHVDRGEQIRPFKDYTVKDSTGQRLFFKSPYFAAKYLGGEIIGYSYIWTPKGIKRVFHVKIEKDEVMNQNTNENERN